MIANTPAESFQPRPFSSVATKTLLPYDEAYPGTLRRVLCASPLRRQGVWLAMAALHSEGSETYRARLKSLADPAAWETNATAETAHILLSKRRVNEIVATLFGPTDGLMGALSKISDAPLSTGSYLNLISLFSDPEHKERAKVLRQLTKITASRLTVLLKLDAPFVLKDLVEKLSVEGVYEFRRSVELILRLLPEASPESLAEAISQLGSTGSVEALIERWLGKAANLPVALPLLDEAEFFQLRSGEALRSAAIRFKNCLRRQIPNAVLGRVAYLEYLPHPVIVQLAPLSGGKWLAEALYGKHNFRIDPEIAKVIWRKLEEGGALIPAQHAERTGAHAMPEPLSLGLLNGLRLEDAIELDELETVA